MSEHHRPYDDAMWVDFTQDINQVQLSDELTSALDQSIGIAVTSLDDSDERRLWITPSEVDTATVRDVLADHEPRDDWGMPQQVLDFREVQEKVVTDPSVVLSDDEVQSALKALLTQQYYASST